MKKTLMALLVMLSAAVSAGAATYTFTVDGVCYQINTTNAPIAQIVRGSYYGVDYSALSGDLVIPPTVTYNGTTYTVHSISNNAFINCANITSITLPEGLEIIYYGAFRNCSSLTSVYLPSTVKSIYGDGTNSQHSPFYECGNLTTIVVASGNTKYDSRDNCNAVVETATNKLIHGCKGTTFPASVTTIGKNAFRGCTITDAVIPEGVTTIETYAFNYSAQLKNLKLPATLSTIGHAAFQGCSSLESIVVADDNTTFDSRDNCNAVVETATNNLIVGCNSTVVPASVVSIGSSAFYGSAITEVTLPDGVTTIDNQAFNRCGQLTKVTLPSTLTNINYGAFIDCTALTDIYAYPAGGNVTLNNDVWVGVDQANCNLHVYPADFDYYSNADQWKEFNVIGDLGEPATGKPGDANGDGDVNVNDVTVTINYILEKNPTPFVFENADVNGDGAVNVMDVTAIINLILNNN